jgi:uncharacterized protein (TIGR03435 family)
MRAIQHASLVALLIGSSLAQAPDPAVEVASVKRHVEQSGRARFTVSGNRVTISALDLYDLILEAYNLKDYQLDGGAGWMGGGKGLSDIVANEQGADFYDISIKAEGDAAITRDQARVLLQYVLADRFQLNVHRESKNIPAYALMVGKHGPKLKESSDDAKFSAGVEMRPSGRMTNKKTTMIQFAGFLSVYADRPVIDRSGLEGYYDFTLEWNLNDDPQSAAPSLFTAVQDQLGLKLEPAAAPVEVWVIDHANRPTVN